MGPEHASAIGPAGPVLLHVGRRGRDGGMPPIWPKWVPAAQRGHER